MSHFSWTIIIIRLKCIWKWIISLYVGVIDLFFPSRTSWFAFKLGKNLLALYHRESLGKTNLRSKLNEKQREKLRNENGSMYSILAWRILEFVWPLRLLSCLLWKSLSNLIERNKKNLPYINIYTYNSTQKKL